MTEQMLLSFGSPGIVWKPPIMCDFEQLFTTLISGAGSLHITISARFFYDEGKEERDTKYR